MTIPVAPGDREHVVKGEKEEKREVEMEMKLEMELARQWRERRRDGRSLGSRTRCFEGLGGQGDQDLDQSLDKYSSVKRSSCRLSISTYGHVEKR